MHSGDGSKTISMVHVLATTSLAVWMNKECTAVGKVSEDPTADQKVWCTNVQKEMNPQLIFSGLGNICITRQINLLFKDDGQLGDQSLAFLHGKNFFSLTKVEIRCIVFVPFFADKFSEFLAVARLG